MLKKKEIKPIVEQSLSGLSICGEAYRQQLDFLLIHLDTEMLTPLINKISEAKDFKGMQQLEAVLRKNFSLFIIKKNELNKEFLAKDIEFNPELGVQLKKIMGHLPGELAQPNQGEGRKPRF